MAIEIITKQRILVQQRHAINLDRLRSSSKTGSVMRVQFSLTAKRHSYSYRGEEIASVSEKDPASVAEYLQGNNIIVKLMR